jgi:Ni,Fe-hydrogenase III large subunit
MVEGFTYIPHRFALGLRARGDDIHWSMTGDNQKLYRWRCRAATYANWPTCATCCAETPFPMRR